MATDILQNLQDAVTNALEYPRNLLYCKVTDNKQAVLRDQLTYRAKKLFCNESPVAAESNAKVLVHELGREDEGFHKTTVKTAAELSQVLQRPISQPAEDPRQRMFYIHAPNSRAQLSISLKMFLQIATYHNVMPTFLEYVFPFGKQHFAQDFHFMGFQSENHLDASNKGLIIPRLGRTGRHIEMCYSLKSVESSSDLPLRRSIRQCSVHHFLDLKTWKSTWVIIKANDLISEAVQHYSDECRKTRLSSAEKEPSIPASSLGIHGILAAWSGDNWHWYISELESYLQSASRPALSASWEIPAPPPSSDSTPTKAESQKRPPTRMASIKVFGRSQTQRVNSMPAPNRANTLQPEGNFQPPQTTGFDGFSFKDLQNVQFVEEKTNEVILVLKSNSNVLKDMINQYRMISTNPLCSDVLPKDFEAAVTRFQQRIEIIQKDIDLQIARAQTLLSVTAGRKSLLNAVFQFRSMEASNKYAEKAQLSAINMENMTQKMSDIAEKTETETVSMRIITCVTLFFLPGTFMAALFSTPIINYQKLSEEGGYSWSHIGVGALKLYAIASLPLVFITFAAWGIMDLSARRQRKKRKFESRDVEKGGANELKIEKGSPALSSP